MAHTDVPQLERLINSLHIQNVTDFYIHIDLKSEESLFMKMIERLPYNVQIVENRVYTTWGGVLASYCL